MSIGQILRRGDVDIIFEDMPADFPGRAPAEFYRDPINWEGIRQFYGLYLDDNGIATKEKVVYVVNVLDILHGAPVRARWVTSYDVFAFRAGLLPRFAPSSASISCVTVTADNKIVVGMRGGALTIYGMKQFGQGRWDTAPAGHLSWLDNPSADLPTQIALAEFAQELSPLSGVVTATPLGITEVYGPRFPGIKFVFRLETSVTFSQLEQTNRTAGDLYRRCKESHVDTVLIKRWFRVCDFPIDVWEHDLLKGISNTTEGIQTALDCLDLIEPSVLALKLYLSSL